MLNTRLLVFSHLLWTGVLAGLALVLNARYPYPETALWFRITLLTLAVTALSPLPLLWNLLYLLWLPPVTFGLATVTFLLYGFMVMRAHVEHRRRRRR